MTCFKIRESLRRQDEDCDADYEFMVALFLNAHRDMIFIHTVWIDNETS